MSASQWRCVERNCGAYAENLDELLCKWHDENRIGQEAPRPLPKPVRQHHKVDLLGCLVYLVIIISGIYLIGQGVRAIL